MPAGSPWQKSGSEVSAGEHRLEMTSLAIDDYEGFQVDDREVLRDGPTYTADTLETFGGDEEIFLILGADAVSRLRTWERHDVVLSRATVLVVPRPGSDVELVSSELPEAIILDMPALEVSGTHIRRMARERRPYRFLVVEPVHDYIEDHQLYAEPGGGDNVGVPERMEKSS